jgi:transcriptional regulator with XRE-family HTH domain
MPKLGKRCCCKLPRFIFIRHESGMWGACLVADTEQIEATIALVAIGQRLQTARKRHKMSVAKLSARTAISVRFIEYIEAGEFGRIPGRTYVLGFTRSICRELDLDPEELLQVVKSEMYEGIGASLEKDTTPENRGNPATRAVRFIKSIF